ncbi:MAG: hypothetical protein JWR69_3390 [Pedosphaera sp.]|nr:hypothetical protein [Pedosphaera sp.]
MIERHARMFQAIKRFVDELRHPRGQPKHLDLTETGLALFEGDREVYRFQWAKVAKIETYKRDLGNVDMICVDFWVDEQVMVYTANDEMTGFSTLASNLIHYFPSVAPDWWSTVAFPAFATNQKVLFTRSAA